MSTNKRGPLAETHELLPFGHKAELIAKYEAAIAKRDELIQRLVDALQYLGDIGVWYPEQAEALNAAEEAGFKPSDQ